MSRVSRHRRYVLSVLLTCAARAGSGSSLTCAVARRDLATRRNREKGEGTRTRCKRNTSSGAPMRRASAAPISGGRGTARLHAKPAAQRHVPMIA